MGFDNIEAAIELNSCTKLVQQYGNLFLGPIQKSLKPAISSQLSKSCWIPAYVGKLNLRWPLILRFIFEKGLLYPSVCFSLQCATL